MLADEKALKEVALADDEVTSRHFDNNQARWVGSVSGAKLTIEGSLSQLSKTVRSLAVQVINAETSY